MTRVLAAVALWTAFVLGLLLFYPWKVANVPCARLVGTPETRAACQPLLDHANDQMFLFQTVPLLTTIAMGYGVILLLELRRRRRAQAGS